MGGRAFVFEYVGLVYGYEWPHRWRPPPFRHANLFGRVTKGEVWLEDTIRLPTARGSSVEGKVAGFMETLYDWSALPFYYVLKPDFDFAFCLVVAFDTPQQEIACPADAQGYCGPRRKPK